MLWSRQVNCRPSLECSKRICTTVINCVMKIARSHPRPQTAYFGGLTHFATKRDAPGEVLPLHGA